MPVIKLLSWHEGVTDKADLLKAAGVTVDAAPLVRTSAVVGELARLDPAALVLDLDRRASYSREIALMLRASKSARHIPILLAGSEAANGTVPAKYARLSSELPDAPWPESGKALSRLMEEPRSAAHVAPLPRVYTASLAEKLGIVQASRKASGKRSTEIPDEARDKPRPIALVGAPEGFVELLGDLPETIRLTTRITPEARLALCFIRSLRELEGVLDMLAAKLPERASAWIVYPKKSARRGGEFNENDIRRSGSAAGFVDYKICSVDSTWSGMKFAHRKPHSDRTSSKG